MQLRTKIFVLTAIVVVASLLLTTIVVRRQVDAAMATDAERDLDATVDAIDELARERRDQREAQIRLLAQLDSLRAHLERDDRDHLDRRLEQLRSSLDQIDLFGVVEAGGRPLAAVGSGRAPFLASRPVPEDVPPLAVALEEPSGEPNSGLWRLGDDLYEVAAIPLTSPGAPRGSRPLGALLLGTRVDDEIARRLHRLTQSQVVILADDEVVASSFPDASLTRTVVERFPELEDGRPMETGSRRISVGGTPHLARLVSVDVDYGGVRCNHLILRSLSEPLALAEGLGRRILAVGLLALVLAFGVAWLGARRIAGPLRRLAEDMSRIARSGRLEPPGEDPRSSREVALFQEAFHRMVNSIEESQKERERSYIEAVEAVMAAIDHRDRESAGHSHRVGRYAVLLARHLGLSGDELKAVEWGALLHDVGKIAVPDAILRKEGPLNESEWRVMRRHPEWGHAILEDVRFLRPALDVVRHHHERWDGEGYPQGLSRDEIPLAARIFSVVDTYDAMTSNRYYREARTHKAALAELRRVAGTQLDPQIVAAFLELETEELWKIRRQTHRVTDMLEETQRLAWRISVGKA